MPKAKFTAQGVKSLKPAKKSVEYIDSTRNHGEGGLGLRISPKGKRTWFLAYTIQGKNKRFTLGTFPELSLAKARELATLKYATVKEGGDPHQEKKEYQEAETFDDLWKTYLRHPETKACKEATRKENQRKYDQLIKPALGNMKVVDIRRKHLNTLLDSYAEKAPVSANRLHALLSVVFNRIALEKEWIETNPMPVKKPFSKEKARSRTLTDKEICDLWKHLEENIFKQNPPDILKMILLTAQRPTEVMGMTWEEVNMDEAVWTIPENRTKTGNIHMVPLSKQVMAILRNRESNNSPYVFPSNHGSKTGYTANIHKARYAIIDKLKMEKWGAHDLRRTARTIMGRLKVKPYIAEKVLNHSVGKIEGIYDRYDYLDEKRVALDKLGREVDRIIDLKSVV